MAQRDIIPLVRGQLVQRDLHRRTIELAAVLRQNALDLTVQKENVVSRGRIRLQTRPPLRHVRHREDFQVVLVDRNPSWLAIYHRDPELTEETEDAACLAGAWSVVVAGDHDDFRLGQHLTEPLKLKKRVEYRRIRGTHGVKDITGDENELRPQLDHDVDDALQRSRDIRLSLIQATRRLPLVLPEAEVYVRDVDQSHRTRIALIH